MLTLTAHQEEALQKLQFFAKDEGSRCFVLRGYAGTGKTTLVGAFVEWLEKEKIDPILLATTGRAAKVLATKTNRDANTVHSCIYLFSEIEGLEAAIQQDAAPGTQLSLQFGLKSPDNTSKRPKVYIVDEASMIANTASKDDAVAQFGSGHLLKDFLEFTGGERVVFVGDPCQLPPVSDDPFSPALSPRYMRDFYHVPVQYAELMEIIRQEASSEILQLAGYFRRSIVRADYIKWAKLAIPKEQSAHLYKNSHQLVEAYLPFLQKKEYDKAVMIVHANRHCRRLNHKIRMMLFDGNKELRKGELLMIVQNNYKVPLTNGDQVVLKSIKPHGVQAGFFFLEVEVESIANKKVYKSLLIRDLLFNDFAGLQNHESRRLLIDFAQRAKAKGLRPKTQEYLEAMKKDPYLNALRAKFGYVITCHKSQGGEWEHVFLNIQKSVYVLKSNPLYRWYYTALTRASEKLHINDGFWIINFNKRQPAANKRFFKNLHKQQRDDKAKNK